MLLTNEQRETASQALLDLIEGFNKGYSAWMQSTGCVANFGWKYGSDQSIKTMELMSIDAIVYRKPPPSFESIAKKLSDPQT